MSGCFCLQKFIGVDGFVSRSSHERLFLSSEVHMS